MEASGKRSRRGAAPKPAANGKSNSRVLDGGGACASGDRVSQSRADGLGRLPIALTGSVWPVERLLMGLRVCKWIQEELRSKVDVLHCTEFATFRGRLCQRLISPPLLALTEIGHPQARFVFMKWNVRTLAPFYKGMTEAICSGFGKGLVHLNLHHAGMRSAGATKFAKVLSSFTSLTHLDLSYNGIGAVGAGRVLGALQNNTVLLHLNLDSCGLGSHGRRGAQYIAEVLEHSPSLNYLNLNSNLLTGSSLTRLFRAIGLCTSLTHLYLDVSFHGLGTQCASGLPALQACTTLARLEMAGVLMNAGHFAAPAVSAFGVLTNLERLNLSGSLEHDDWSKTDLPLHASITQLVGRCRQLVHLDLSENGIDDAWCVQLAGVLGGCAGLQELILNRNKIGRQGARALGTGALPQLTALRTLDLGFNSVGAGTKHLVTTMRACTRMERLDLRLNELGSVGAAGLAEALTHCAALTWLEMRSCCLGSEGAALLSAGLAHCSSLEHLDLSYDVIADTGAQALAGALSECKNLRSLFLVSCGIGGRGGAALAGLFEPCLRLRTLSLSGNRLGGAGAACVQRALSELDNRAIYLSRRAIYLSRLRKESGPEPKRTKDSAEMQSRYHAPDEDDDSDRPWSEESDEEAEGWRDDWGDSDDGKACLDLTKNNIGGRAWSVFSKGWPEVYLNLSLEGPDGREWVYPGGQYIDLPESEEDEDEDEDDDEGEDEDDDDEDEGDDDEHDDDDDEGEDEDEDEEVEEDEH